MIEAMTQPVYLSLGSNLGDREGNLRAALRLLSRHARIEEVSPLYETAPVGLVDQPHFLNCAVAVGTQLEPHQLLHAIKDIEREVGRTPAVRWGPRVIDLDIVLYGDRVLHTPELTIPHRDMTNRAFVLVPLAEIAPDVIHPVLRVSVRDLCARVEGRDDVKEYQKP